MATLLRTGFVRGMLLSGLTIAAWMLAAQPASAHIVHPGNAFDDIGFSDYRNEIVYISTLGLIIAEEGGAVYRPGEPLERAELAYWAAVFGGLATAEEPERARQLALEHGLLPSLDGIATCADINSAIFAGEAILDADTAAELEVTREQYAAFVAAHAAQPVGGLRLEERAGLVAGPAGTVEVVGNSEAAFGYELHIAGEVWTLSKHPRVVDASGDPQSWNGLKMGASWMTQREDGTAVLQLLDFRAVSPAAEADAPTSAAGDSGSGASSDGEGMAGAEEASVAGDGSQHSEEQQIAAASGGSDENNGVEAVGGFVWIATGALLLVLAGGLLLYLRRRRSA